MVRSASGKRKRRIACRLAALVADMEQASAYPDWLSAAREHDELTGADAWREEDDTDLYDYQLIRSRARLLRKLRRTRDIPRLVFYLNEELHGNLGNMANPALYGVALAGTKRLITDYLDEVVATLDDLCRLRSRELPAREKLAFFRRAAHSFGRTGLLLSGGATLGLFHLGVVKALWESRALPVVLSGSSAGSIVAAVVATHTDDELGGIFDPGYVNMEAWRDFGLDALFEGRGLGDIDKLRHASMFT